MDASNDLIDSRVVEYVKKIDEFIDYETELIALYKKRLSIQLRVTYYECQADIISSNKKRIENIRNMITEHSKTHSFLINLKTDYELVRYSDSPQGPAPALQSIIVRLTDAFYKSESTNYHYPIILINILEGKPTCDIIGHMMIDYLKNIPDTSEFDPIRGLFHRNSSQCCSVEKPCSSALCELLLARLGGAGPAFGNEENGGERLCAMIIREDREIWTELRCLEKGRTLPKGQLVGPSLVWMNMTSKNEENKEEN